jgi:hypothetical protein
LPQRVKKGSLQITKIDVLNKRISGVFTCTLETISDKAQFLIEGSFTDVFYRNGYEGGEVVTADVSGHNYKSNFSSQTFFPGFGNNSGQGIKSSEYFAIVTSTEGITSNGYEALSFYLKKPLHTGSFDIDSGCAYYYNYVFDPIKSVYLLTQADTNCVSIPQAVTVTEFDTLRRRISGTFNYVITDNSSRSPLEIRNGKFIDLFW